MKIGEKVPDFELNDQHGNLFRLSDATGDNFLVLFFYPKDNTMICTAEACSFRDQHLDFKESGAEIVGISNDSEHSHQGFANEHQLPYRLLSDPGGKVKKLFGVKGTFGLVPGRITFVIDPAGTIIEKFDSLTNHKGHVRSALKAIRAKGESPVDL